MGDVRLWEASISRGSIVMQWCEYKTLKLHCNHTAFLFLCTQKQDDQRSSHSRVNADDVIEQIFSG